MPERPDLEYQIPLIDAAIAGRTIVEARVHDPVVVRRAVKGELPELLVGRRFTGAWRRGHFVMFGLADATEHGGLPLELAVHPMLAGRFTQVAQGRRLTKDTGVAWLLDDGTELRYRDRKQMGKVYLLEAGAYAGIPRLEKIGLDVLDPAVFTFEVFAALAKKRRDQVKLFLLDKAALDSLGNAYADEVMWAGRVHPKTRVRDLDEAQLRVLHGAIVETLSSARDEIARRAPSMDEKVRDFLRVRNRKGEDCPRCGGLIRTCGVRGHDAFFCARCQPDGRRSTFVDWRKTGR